MTVAELGSRMSSAEFMAWVAYAELEPFGPLREDLRAGHIAALIANIARSMGKRPSTAKPSDWFPELAEPEPPVDVVSKLRAWVARSRR